MASSAKDIQLRELMDTVSQLKTMMAEQTELIRSLRTVIDEKTAHEAVLQEQVDYLTKKLFGTSSEKTHSDIPGQLNLFNEAEAEQDPSLPEEDCIEEPSPRKKKATHAELFKGLTVHKQVIPLAKEDKICPVCGTPMERIGEEYVRRELVFTPARCEIYEYYTESYGCPNCKDGKGDTEKAVIIKSKAAPALIGKGPASLSTVAWTIYQKYANGMPLYRQEKDWKEYGAAISRTTLANWIIYSAEHYFRPLYDYFHRQLLQREFLMADETRVQVLKEPGRSAESQSFMWLFRTGEDGQPVILLYGYTPTRSGNNAADFLDGFQGYLETDGYQGYNKVSGIKRCSCWAHIRRYFVDAIPKGKQLDYNQPAVQGVHYCDRLARLESTITSNTFFEKTYPVARRPQWNPDLYTLSDSSLQFQKNLPFPALPPSVSPAWSAFFCRNMLPVLVQNPQEQILCIAIPFQIPQKENVWYFHKMSFQVSHRWLSALLRKYFSV